MNTKRVIKIRYINRTQKESYYDELLKTEEYWTEYFEQNEDNYPKKRKKESKSFAKWCVDSGNIDKLVKWEKNNDCDPSQIGAGSSNKINIFCKEGHVYSGVANDIFHGSKCPYCSGHKVLKGFNDLATLRPDLAAEWDDEKNTVKSDEVTIGTHRKAWWICPKKHNYEMNIYDRVNFKRGCLICKEESLKIQSHSDDCINSDRVFNSNLSYDERLQLTKEYWSSYFSTHEDSYPRQRYNSESFAKWCVDTNNIDLLVDWDKNNFYDPLKIGRAARRRVTILCSQEHLYDTMPLYVSNGNGCPYCTGNKVQAGFNDFLSKRPLIASEWDYEKNAIRPDEVTSASTFEAWWICPKKHHSYKMQVRKRTSANQGCPICASKEVISGERDLRTLYPSLMSEWDSEKNTILPDTVLPGSHIKVWWKCKKGHEWYAQINSRALNGNGCPVCNNSRGEEAIKKFLDQNGIEYITEFKFQDRRMPDSGCMLRDDFAIMDQGKVICTIEYHGIQHEIPVDFASRGQEYAKANFKRIKERDAFKTAYLKRHGIPQLIIWYYNFDRIPELVENFLQNIFLARAS